MTEKINIPELRFSGFTESWEKREVTKLGDIFIGLVTTMTKNYTTDGTLLIRNSDIKENRFEFGKNPIYLEKTFAERNSTRMHLLGDVITVHTGDVGTSAVITENEVNSIGFATIVTRPNPKIVDSKYFSSFLNTNVHKRWAVSISTGDGRTNYNLGDYKKLIVPLPELHEQKMIAQFIDYLSNLINFQQSKIEKLEIVKKSILMKMFPKDGSDIPEIRFVGFTDAWEHGELDIWANRYDNLRIPITASDRVSGNTPYYGANGIQDYVKGFTHDGEFVLIAEDGANDLKNYPVQYINGKIWVNNHVHVLQAKNDIADNKFLKYVISQTNIEPFLVGGGRAKLNAYTMMKICIKVPENLDEQKKLGILLHRFDNLLTFHQSKLVKLQNIKKSMLNKMFVTGE